MQSPQRWGAEMGLTVIGRDLVRALLPMDRAIDLMDGAMRATAAGRTIQPPRWMVDLPGGSGNLIGLMPSYMAEPGGIAAKVTVVYPANHALGLQSHQGIVVLFELEHGTPIAILHGGEITAIRTAAASGLATRALARPDARHLAVLGYGEQAVQHIRAIMLVRPITSVSVWGRSPDKARAFADRWSGDLGIAIRPAESVAAAVANADIICTVSAAPSPVLTGAMVPAGCHLNIVGSSSARHAEIDGEVLRRARVFVDLRSAVEANGGDVRQAIAEGIIDADHILGELGEVLGGTCPGRTDPHDITLYKSVGIPVQDLACAIDIVRRAIEQGLGTSAPF